ncbi:RNA recognition motif domain-containing protein [Chloroflexota bacterium]
MRIYVGNLSPSVTKNEVSAEFALYGKVDSVDLPSDSLSRDSKGFAFVEMSSNSEAKAAIKGLNGKTLEFRTLVISEARPRKDHRGGSSNSNRRKVGYGSGGNYGGGKQRRYSPI